MVKISLANEEVNLVHTQSVERSRLKIIEKRHKKVYEVVPGNICVYGQYHCLDLFITLAIVHRGSNRFATSNSTYSLEFSSLLFGITLNCSLCRVYIDKIWNLKVTLVYQNRLSSFLINDCSHFASKLTYLLCIYYGI